MNHSIMASLLMSLGCMLAFATPSLAMAEERDRHQSQRHQQQSTHARGNDHGVRQNHRRSTPHSRHEAIKRRHLQMFNGSRSVERRRHSGSIHHQPRNHQPYRSHAPRYPHGIQRSYQGRHPHGGASIGLPSIRIKIH